MKLAKRLYILLCSMVLSVAPITGSRGGAYEKIKDSVKLILWGFL